IKPGRTADADRAKPLSPVPKGAGPFFYVYFQQKTIKQEPGARGARIVFMDLDVSLFYLWRTP
ncbi:MAG TPA: hypothetical protein VLQ89_03290, partial [Candidatus Binatia bacterium]|nr:hypothetical protein [Candidatus Binatia bacterium]